ncbi:FxsA family protein [Lapillicoccus sp.]|uniref:FxsA family protein n=1 Tax=Lapillicoccus sp. TaxID=1909287 RepID=UPI0039834A4F
MAPAVGRTRRPGHARRWSALLVVVLLVLPLLEIVAIIGVGKVIGGWPTFFLLLAESALGAWLVRREGARTWQALTGALTTGRMPSRQLADAALVLVGGTLLLTPGFLSDVVGFFFILPFTRPLARGVLERVVSRRLLGAIFPGQPDGHGPQGPFGGSPPGRSPGPAPTAPADDVIEGEIL